MRWSRARGVVRGTALGFCAGAASFSMVAVTLAAARSDAVAVLLGVVSAAVVVEVTRRWGVARGNAVAIATLVAYDWF